MRHVQGLCFCRAFSHHSFFVLIRACGTRLADKKRNQRVFCRALASPFIQWKSRHLKLRHPRRQEVPSKGVSGSLRAEIFNYSFRDCSLIPKTILKSRMEAKIK